MFNDAFNTKEDFLDTCKSKGWDTPEELEFFGHFFDHISKLDREGKNDPLDLDSLGVNLAQLNGKNRTERSIFINKMRQAMDHPEYDLPEAMKEGFKKVESRVIELDPREKKLEELDRKKQALMKKNEEAEKAADALLQYLDEALEEQAKDYEKKNAEAAKKAQEEDEDDVQDPDLKAAYDAKYVKLNINLGKKGDYASSVSKDEYLKKLKDAGWTYAKDLAVFESLYRLSEILDHPSLESTLNASVNRSHGINANSRMTFFQEIRELFSKLIMTERLNSSLRDKITGCMEELDQETIDANYWDNFHKTRPKTGEEEAAIKWQKKQVEDGQEIIADYNLTQFVDKAKENGWTTQKDIKFVTDIYNYRKENRYRENRKMDLILMDIINYPVWGIANRERVFRKMEETFKGLENNRNFYSIERVRKDQQPYIKELKTYLKDELQSRTDAYYEEQHLAQFGKAYQKTGADLEKERKAEEEARKEQERRYEDAIWENRRKFDADFPLSGKEFLNTAEECGWLGTYSYDDRDLIGLGDLYEVTGNSGNERLLGLLNKILITDVTTKKNRDAFVKEIQDTVSDVLTEGSIFGRDAEKLKKICDGEGILPNVSAEEIERTRKRYENKQNRDGNLEEFHRIMLRRNWDEEDFPFFDSLYDFQTKRVDQKGSSPIDKELEAFMKKKVGYFNPAIDKNTILREFRDAVGSSSLNEDDKFELDDMINKKISQGLKEETREKETISFNNAEVSIAKDYDYDPKTYYADAEFRNEKEADKAREKAEAENIAKELEAESERTDVVRNKVAGEQIFAAPVVEEQKIVAPVAEEKKVEAPAVTEAKVEEKKAEAPVVAEPKAEEKKINASVVKEQDKEDQKSVSDASSVLPNININKSIDSPEDNRINNEKSFEEVPEVRIPVKNKKKKKFVERDLSLDFDLKIDEVQNGQKKTEDFVKNIYVFNYARICLMSAIDKERNQLAGAKQTNDVKNLRTFMRDCRNTLNGNRFSMHQMYNAVSGLCAVAQNTEGYDSLRCRVMLSVFAEAVRPLMDVKGANIVLAGNSADVPVKELYNKTETAMMAYDIAKPAKGSSRDAYVVMENRAKARFLMHENLSKACGKPVLTTFIDTDLVNSLVTNGRPKTIHEMAKDRIAKTILDKAEAPGANTETIKGLTEMIKNKGFVKMVEELEKKKDFQDRAKRQQLYMKQMKQHASQKKHFHGMH